jgi:internalin A
MKRFWVLVFALYAVRGWGLAGDINGDGVVGFDDFFLLADQFGQEGPPEAADTVRVTVVETLQVVVRDTVLAVSDTTKPRTGFPVAFGDPGLEFAIRELIDVPAGAVLSGDVQDLTLLDLSGLNIAVLDGLQNFVSLETLSLSNNFIVDLGPLAGLPTLHNLSLAGNRIRDITPLMDNLSLGPEATIILAANPLSVAALTQQVPLLQDRGVHVSADPFVVTFADSNLEVTVRRALIQPEGDLLNLDLEALTNLDASNTSIATLDGLQFMRGLKRLELDQNPISDLSPLAGLKKLEHLNLSQTLADDTAPLAGLTKLRQLDLGGARVTDLRALAGLEELEILSVNQNAIDDISFLSGLGFVQQLNLRDNKISDMSVLLDMGSLTDVWLEENPRDAKTNDTVIPTLVDKGVFVRF